MPLEINMLEKSKTYQEIKKKICKHLIEDWRSNDRLPPIKDLAKHLGVGQSSAHLAVKELVREGILVSRPRMGTFVTNEISKIKPKLESLLNETAASMAQSPLVGKKIQMITYRSVFDIHTFFTRAINSFAKAIGDLGCEFVTTLIDKTDATDIEPLLDKSAHGIAVVNPSYLLPVKCLPSQIVTVISPSSECTMAMSERFDLIAVDDTQGSLLAGEFLRRKNWKDVCFLGVKPTGSSDRYDKTSQKRLDGLSLGLGAPIRPEWQLWSDVYVCFQAAACVRNWLKLDPRPSVVFAASDDLAYGFMYGASAHGLHPGKDYQIIGFDGQLTGPFYDGYTLTSVAIPIVEMGTVAAKMIAKRLQEPDMTPRRTYLGCKIHEGNTVVDNTGR